MDQQKDKWDAVEKVDLMKRKPHEWAKIYNFQIMGIIEDGLWDEYEWAFNLGKIRYFPLPDKHGEFDKASEMELRAQELRRDLFMGADIGEKYVLEEENKYIETEWIRKRIKF